jgi:chromosomal replication initiation ATPase DnaA
MVEHFQRNIKELEDEFIKLIFNKQFKKALEILKALNILKDHLKEINKF